MNIWLVTIGEPIPHSGNQLRLHRTGIIANLIAQKTNHNLTWWTSDFNHFEKVHIYGDDKIINITSNFKVVALHGRGYKKNVSIDRILDHKEIAKKFKTKALNHHPPDIIVVAFPTLGLCEVSIELGKKWEIPVIVDYRDMWPEVFLEILPHFLRRIFKIFLAPLFQRTNGVFRNAAGLIGITDEFLSLGLQKIGRLRNKYDAVFPLAYLSNQFTIAQSNEASIFWNEFLLRSSRLRIIFIGTLGHQFDFETVIDAMHILKDKGIEEYEIILCGSGDKESYLLNESTRLSNLHLPGYISAAQINFLLLNSDVGICPYKVNKAFLNSIPGKAIEYMSAGLTILTTLEDGELGKLCKSNDFGFFYSIYNPISLASTIERLINEKDELSLKNEKIKSLYEANFKAESVYLNYIKHLEMIVNDEAKR